MYRGRTKEFNDRRGGREKYRGIAKEFNDRGRRERELQGNSEGIQ